MRGAFAIALLLAIVPALARGQTGTLIGPAPVQIPEGKRMSEDGNRRLLFEFVSCLVTLRQPAVKRLINTVPGSAEAQKQARDLMGNDCLSSGRLNLNEGAIRAAAYDVLYNREFRSAGPVDFTHTAAIEYVDSAPGAVIGMGSVQLALRQLADCAVRRDPASARSLILSKAGSPAEGAAFQTLVPAVSACVKKDSKLQFSKLTLRGFVGEALYRLSVADKLSVVAAKGG